MKPIEIDRNSVALMDLNNISQDFNNLLSKTDSITYIKCININININTCINKIVIKNCSHVEINIDKIISGIEIINSNNINIITTKNKPIYHLLIDESNVINIIINKKNFKATEIDIIDSNNIEFLNFNNKKIFQL